MSAFWKRWRKVLLATAGVTVLLVSGALWWLAHPPVAWEQVTASVEPVSWQGQADSAGRAALLTAWVMANTPPGSEVWVGTTPPDAAVEVSPGWRVIGAIRMPRPLGIAEERLWLEAPDSSPVQAGRQILQALRRAGWAEPGRERLDRRLSGLPPALLRWTSRWFAYPVGASPEDTLLLCRPEANGLAQTTLALLQRPDGSLIAALHTQRGSPFTDACNGVVRALGNYLPVGGSSLPGVVQVPHLTPPEGAQLIAEENEPLPVASATLTHLVLLSDRSPMALRTWFDGQMQREHWQQAGAFDDDAVAWSEWQRRSLLGHHYRARLMVWKGATQRRWVALIIRREGAPLPASEAQPPSEALRVHGNLASPAGQALVETWMLDNCKGRARFRLSVGKLVPPKVTWPAPFQPLGTVRMAYVSPSGGTPEETGLALYPRTGQKPARAELLHLLDDTLQRQGWRSLPVERPKGWESLAASTARVAEGHWCLPKYGDELALEMLPWKTPADWLIDLRYNPSVGGMGCQEKYDAADPFYFLGQRMPDWSALRPDADVVYSVISDGVPTVSAMALEQWAWFKPRVQAEALWRDIDQSMAAQGWQRVSGLETQAAFGERWQRVENGQNFWLEAALLPLGDGTYLGHIFMEPSFTP